MLRRPVARAMRPGPNLVGTVARTAVIAGTAQAVTGKVAQKQAASAAQAQAAQAAQAPPPPPPAAAAPAAAPAPAAGAPDLIEQLTQLGELRDKGILTEAEFEVQKQKLLASS
ncbi:MAG: SHOCT domain-containing protein [Acidimicrobiales bacterium]